MGPNDFPVLGGSFPVFSPNIPCSIVYGNSAKEAGIPRQQSNADAVTAPVSIAPKGLFGGHVGTTGHFELNPETNHARPLRSKGLDTVQADDLVRLTLPGAGGYGDPKERSLDALDRDLMDGKVTPEAAEAHYAVVVDRAVPCIERYATQCLREKMAAAKD